MTLAPSLKQDREISLAWDCARHLLSAGERSQAAALLMNCARHALELGRPLEADEILRGSLDLPLSAAERISLLKERGHALRAADQWNDIVVVLSDFIADGWERPLRRSDLDALGSGAPDGEILGARVEHVGAERPGDASRPAPSRGG